MRCTVTLLTVWTLSSCVGDKAEDPGDRSVLADGFQPLTRFYISVEPTDGTFWKLEGANIDETVFLTAGSIGMADITQTVDTTLTLDDFFYLWMKHGEDVVCYF